jgi:hypothetical protein
MPSTYEYERILFGIIDRVKSQMLAKPLFLGGISASGGGSGGPSGGFVGYLPQTKVSYDLSEAATMAVPASGMSLVDNLNHIRSRIGTLETSSSGSGHTIRNEGVDLPARTYLDFVGIGVVASDDSVNDTTTVTISGAGGGGDVYLDQVNTFTRKNIFTSTNSLLDSDIMGIKLVSSGDLRSYLRFYDYTDDVIAQVGQNGSISTAGGVEVNTLYAAGNNLIVHGGNVGVDTAFGVFSETNYILANCLAGEIVSMSPVGTVFNSSGAVDLDFTVNTDIYGALFVDASENSIQIINDPAGFIGFYGSTPVAQSTGWDVAVGYTADKALDPESTTLTEVARTLGTLIDQLKALGLLGGV